MYDIINIGLIIKEVINLNDATTLIITLISGKQLAIHKDLQYIQLASNANPFNKTSVPSILT